MSKDALIQEFLLYVHDAAHKQPTIEAYVEEGCKLFKDFLDEWDKFSDPTDSQRSNSLMTKTAITVALHDLWCAATGGLEEESSIAKAMETIEALCFSEQKPEASDGEDLSEDKQSETSIFSVETYKRLSALYDAGAHGDPKEAEVIKTCIAIFHLAAIESHLKCNHDALTHYRDAMYHNAMGQLLQGGAYTELGQRPPSMHVDTCRGPQTSHTLYRDPYKQTAVFGTHPQQHQHQWMPPYAGGMPAQEFNGPGSSISPPKMYPGTDAQRLNHNTAPNLDNLKEKVKIYGTKMTVISQDKISVFDMSKVVTMEVTTSDTVTHLETLVNFELMLEHGNTTDILEFSCTEELYPEIYHAIMYHITR